MSHNKDGIAFLDMPEEERRDSCTPGGPDLGCKLLAQRLKSEKLSLGTLFLDMPHLANAFKRTGERLAESPKPKSSRPISYPNRRRSMRIRTTRTV